MIFGGWFVFFFFVVLVYVVFDLGDVVVVWY